MEDPEASDAIALVTAASMINEEEGEGSADTLTLMAMDIAFKKDPAYVCQVIAYLASYGSVVLQMAADAADADPDIIHQEIALAIARTEEGAS